MELVEQHRANAGEFGVVEDHPGENALGHDLDTGAGRDLGAEAHPQSHSLADRLAQGLGHALGGAPGGEAARLQHDDPGIRWQPWCIEEREGHAGGLSRARRRHKDGARRRRQGRAQLRQDLVDGEAEDGFRGAHGEGWCDARREIARASCPARGRGGRPMENSGSPQGFAGTKVWCRQPRILWNRSRTRGL